MRPHRDVPMLAAALALAFAAAPAAFGHQLPAAGGGGDPSVASGDPSVANCFSPTPHSLGLPGGTLCGTGGGDPAPSLPFGGQNSPRGVNNGYPPQLVGAGAPGSTRRS